ncbi:MAG: caa(3)-type cytochrome c oxidase subunit 2 [Desulfobulbaceae bacterium BRH_c16a]|nr:MAG: caa(3)-type cytochrome c oxidase subunit 2 [Desulfobulbaceae bacterium BRH_c16a]
MTSVQGVDQAFWYILGISIVLLFGITAVMVYFVIKYRRSKNPVPSDIRDNYKLEIFWTVIPTLIALSMFYIGWTSYLGLRTVPEDALEVLVEAQMFSWLFIYENDKESENELVVPKGRAIKLNITSVDVVHSFYLPAFRVKVDAVKGMPTYAWFFADEVGEFDIQCTEYCGTDHSAMVGRLRIVPQEEYEAWLEESD